VVFRPALSRAHRRISPENGVDRAIENAKRAGTKLKIAAKVDRADREYLEEKIRGLLSDPLVGYIGEISDDRKNDFLGNAFALILPIDWPEPFGLVMIEAMACGTPVISFRRGSVPEVVERGVTGIHRRERPRGSRGGAKDRRPEPEAVSPDV
jgi:glycosyltransferase involved in cell wall biosynthesis